MRKVRVAEGPHRSNGLRVLGLPEHQFVPIVVLVFLILILAGPASGAEPATVKNVLVLFSSFARNNADLLNVTEPAVRARVVPEQITFYDAYLEYSRIKEKSYRESQAETFRHTYDGVKFSLVPESWKGRRFGRE